MERSWDDVAAPEDARHDRRLLLRMEGFFAERSAAFVLIVAVLLLALIATIDLLTDPVLSPSLVYLVPVVLVTWRLGRGIGVAGALVATGAWTVADVVSGKYPSHNLAPYWNAVMHFGGLSIVVLLLATVREVLQRERELAVRETATADELRQMNELKDTLLHALSHDLKGSIAAILGAAQALDRAEQLQLTPEEHASMLDAIRMSGRKLDRMVTDLLDLERLDRGLVRPECEPTDIAALARNLVAEAGYLSDHPTRVVAEPIVISVDAGKVERILENLLSNAAKHTPVGTPIIVRVAGEPGGAMLAVEDEGPGVPEELKETIFQPFRQGEVAKAAGAGAGIGLSLVARFAELHGGRAWVEDRSGRGTVFRVFLPGAVATGPPAERARPASVVG